MVLVIILILLAAIILMPVGVYASYTGGSLTVTAHVWLYKLGLYPPKEKKAKVEDAEPTEADADAEQKDKKSPLSDFMLDDWRKLIKTALRALRHFKKVVFFDIIRLRAVISAPDPYDAVMRYNTVNGFVGSIIPFFESGFRVKKRDIYIDLDMQSGESRAEAELSVSVRLGAALAVGLAAGFSLLKILIKNRIRRIRERVARNGEQQIERNDADNNGQHQESC